jgi:uncharacterized protein (TIGR02466 family)
MKPPNFNISFRGLGVAKGQAVKGLGAHEPAPTLKPYELFATRIWQAHLLHLAPYFEAWTSETAAIRAASPGSAGRTNRGGWNSRDLTILDRQPLAPLREAVNRLCAEALGQTYGGPVRFGLQSWINMHERGGFNFAHMHEGCLLSGVFYLQVPKGSGALMLRDPRPGAVNSPAKGAGSNANMDIRLQPDAGLVVLFPNWLEHYVEMHEGDTPRISIAFNAVRPPAAGSPQA